MDAPDKDAQTQSEQLWFLSPMGFISLSAWQGRLMGIKLMPPNVVPDPDRCNTEPLDPILRRLKKSLEEYFAGLPTDFSDYACATQELSSPFAHKVWEACRSIPWGETKTYGALAQQAGKPGAARAVGSALNSNPLPIVVPCHRVIKSDGKLGGFGAGTDWKKFLLKLEGIKIGK